MKNGEIIKTCELWDIVNSEQKSGEAIATEGTAVKLFDEIRIHGEVEFQKIQVKIEGTEKIQWIAKANLTLLE